jgi:hypothetical protein
MAFPGKILFAVGDNLPKAVLLPIEFNRMVICRQCRIHKNFAFRAMAVFLHHLDHIVVLLEVTGIRRVDLRVGAVLTHSQCLRRCQCMAILPIIKEAGIISATEAGLSENTVYATIHYHTPPCHMSLLLPISIIALDLGDLLLQMDTSGLGDRLLHRTAE